jgi:type VI secretion system secreted protein Hcp
VVDYFLKIDGIDGESTDAAHPGEIEPISFHWNEVVTLIRDGGGGGSAAGKVNPSDFQIAKRVDKSSPVLMVSCATGRRFKTAVLVGRKAGDRPLEFLKITLEDVLITSYGIGGVADAPSPVNEQLTLTFATLEMIYREQRPDGSAGAEVKRKFDFVRNVAT